MHSPTSRLHEAIVSVGTACELLIDAVGPCQQSVLGFELLPHKVDDLGLHIDVLHSQ
jgi:hypothetical protein